MSKVFDAVPSSSANHSSYRTTLNSREETTDEAEKEEMLKSCHKRCAERTLNVLEKNGGIFIKLGQHLVRFPALHASLG